MRKKYFLIDTENVGDRWMELLETRKEEDTLVVFYTKNHSKLLEECYLKQRYNRQILWVECVVGSNALDQQLTGVLSYLIASQADGEYFIYSNDKDYQNVIDFWQQRGFSIGRVGFATDKRRNRTPAQDMALPEDPGKTAEEQIIREIGQCVPVTNMSGWYLLLVSLLGQDSGRDYYVQLKEDEGRRQELSRYLLPDVDERNIRLVALIYRQNHMDEEKAELAYKIVKGHNKKNTKAIQADFDKQFGKKTNEQARYYKVIKPVIPILKGK